MCFRGDFVIKVDIKDKFKELEQNGFTVYIAKSNNAKMHGHSFLEFTYIEKGEFEHSFENKKERLTQGDYFIVDYGTQHAYRSIGDSPVSVINFLFYPSFVDRTLKKTDSFEKVVNSYLIRFNYTALNSSPSGVVFGDKDGSIYKIVGEILNEYQNKQSGYLEYIRSLCAQMLIIIMRRIEKSGVKSTNSKLITSITDYTNEHYNQKLKLCDFAKKHNYSLSHLSKKFLDETGMNFSEYLQKLRIEKSCSLLETTDLSVLQIATEVGYNDIKFFNKIFKKQLGITPRQFRNLSKK